MTSIKIKKFEIDLIDLTPSNWDVKNEGECWWNTNWENANYSIPKTFGLKNYLKQYSLKETNLTKFKQP